MAATASLLLDVSSLGYTFVVVPCFAQTAEISSQNILSKQALKEFHDDLIILNRYYIETRYPGDFPEFSWADAQQAFEAANKIKEFTGKRIKV